MNKIKLPAEYFKGNGITVQKAQISRQRIIEIINEAIEADRKTPDDTVLTCDSCGAICQNPWHTSHGQNRHVHLCDVCYEADRQVRGDTIYMVQHCSEKNRWQMTTKERFLYLKEYENRGDWEFMAVMAVTI